jgi:hypothetical protein
VTDVLKATYADLKTVKTRSTCQLILELPIEALTDVVALLGAPVPGNEVWVAVARLRPEAVQQEPEQLEPPRPLKSLAQIAGIICNEQAFWKYIDVTNAAEAAEYVRGHCNVSSRAALDHNPDAALAFRTLRTDYGLWLQGVDGAAA